MPKAPAFTCSACGAAQSKWTGRCDACGAWNSLTEAPARQPGAPTPGRPRPLVLTDLASAEAPPPRTRSRVDELDRVLGGGLVPGSATLLAGDPGIGKSTLLLQSAAAFARAGLAVVYVSGEEAAAQVRLRAERLGLGAAPVRLAAETRLDDILAALDGAGADLVVIDSVQTLWLDGLDSAPGSVAQVRACAHALAQFAKRRGAAVVLVGHVTKDGQIAGPRVVEHMVDCVLAFEGERGHPYRLLRSIKNRFGPAGEIGVFEMTGSGLAQVANPSALFLGDRGPPTAGAAVFAGIEGTRPLLCEIQALVAPAPAGSARRSVVGWDSGRLAMLLAVLEARCGLPFAGLDVYLNVAGGLRIGEPAADLAAACALISAREDTALPEATVVFGEISLSAAIRPAAQPENRLKEAVKLGFTRAIMPLGGRLSAPDGMTLDRYGDLADLVGGLFGAG